MRIALTMTTLVFVVLILTFTTVLSENRPTNNGTYVIVSARNNEDSTTTFWRENPDGNHRVKITTIAEPYRADNVYLSPNTEWLMYWSVRDNGTYDIVRHQPSDLDQILTVVSNIEPLVTHNYRVTEDRTKSLLGVRRGDRILLFQFNADASAATLIDQQNNTFGAVDYMWSPDNNAFNYFVVGGTPLSYIVNEKDTPHQIMNSRAQSVVWAPNGKHFLTVDAEGKRAIIDLDTMERSYSDTNSYADLPFQWVDDNWIISRSGSTYYRQRLDGSERDILNNVSVIYPSFDEETILATHTNGRELVRINLSDLTQETIYSAKDTLSIFFVTDHLLFALADDELIRIDGHTFDVLLISPASVDPQLPITAADIRFHLSPDQEWLFLTYLVNSRERNPIRLQIGLQEDVVNELSQAHLIGFSDFYGKDFNALPWQTFSIASLGLVTLVILRRYTKRIIN